MISIALFAVLSFSAPSAPIPTVLLAQEENPIVDDRPEVAALIEELKTNVKGKGEKDPEAIGNLDSLMGEFEQSGPKDRAAIIKAFASCFDAKRTKELDEGVPDNRLYLAAAVALGSMGPESVKTLSSLIGNKKHRKDSRLQQTLALSLGKTKSLDGLKTLMDLLKHKDAPMQASGAEALAYFADASLDTRKEVFGELLKTMMGQKAKKDDVTDLEAQDRWNTISGPIIDALQKLSGHSETDPDMWQRWWNDNKKGDWAAAE